MYKSENGITLHNEDRCIGCKRCQTACPYSACRPLEYEQVQYSVISYNTAGLETHSFYKNEQQIIAGCTASPKELAELAGEIPPTKNNYTHPDYSAGRRPDVTEKCIFCDHRLQNNENPYCVDSCPSGAPVFSDLDDSQSQINQELAKGYKRLKNNKGEFLASGEAGTQPNVFYLEGGDTPTATKYVEKPEVPMIVYPNPASNITSVKFSLEEASEVSLTVFDFQGRKVQDIASNVFRMSGEHVFEFNVSGMEPGTFFVRLVTEICKNAGLQFDTNVKDLPDHVSVESQFIYYLLHKIFQHITEENKTEAARLFELLGHFYKKHYRIWIPLFCEKITQETKNDYYLALARSFPGFVKNNDFEEIKAFS